MGAKPIMIMGTMSSAGKSFLTAGLCRLFRQDGYRVAPFKSQNMALNAYVTKNGLEMGRAQAVQAEAAGIEPDVRMNPILLKPTSEKGSQVIVNGEVLDTMEAKEYYRHKSQLLPYVKASYESLASEYDIIVIEGAGSPAEINLKDVDIVNMGMANLANAPVILVGDIDRGGVFAALYGTIALLEPKERARIKGFAINKFRGDLSILQNGLEMLEERTGIPVLGVIPYLPVILEEEDSCSTRLAQHSASDDLDIAVIQFPRISNYTDFHALELLKPDCVRYVTDRDCLGNPDLLILPGTKNTIRDLVWMRETGLEAAVLKLHAKKTIILGICGGMQMLGETISDPDGIEYGGQIRGIGLLPLETVFTAQKCRRQTTGLCTKIPGRLAALSGHAVSGYEMHMGRTICNGKAACWIQDETGTEIGYCNTSGTVLGTYLHGLFDHAEIAQTLLAALGVSEGVTTFDLQQRKEQTYNQIADMLRQALDMEQIYTILEQGGLRHE